MQVKMPPGEVTLLGICPVAGSGWRMIVPTAHHLVMVHGDCTADIKALARILGVEYCQI